MYLCPVLNKYVVPKVSFNRNFVCGVAGSFDHLTTVWWHSKYMESGVDLIATFGNQTKRKKRATGFKYKKLKKRGRENCQLYTADDTDWL